MHRLPSQASVRRIRIVSILIIIKSIAIPAIAILMIVSMVMEQRQTVTLCLGLFALFIPLSLIEWSLAARTNCPLCITPVLGKKACHKHRHATKFLGSHRLKVALSAIFKGSFRCPYCNEPTALEVRNRHGRKNNSRTYSRG